MPLVAKVKGTADQAGTAGSPAQDRSLPRAHDHGLSTLLPSRDSFIQNAPDEVTCNEDALLWRPATHADGQHQDRRDPPIVWLSCDAWQRTTVPYTSVSDVEAFFERVQKIAEPKPPKKIDSSWVPRATSFRPHTRALFPPCCAGSASRMRTTRAPESGTTFALIAPAKRRCSVS